jgi:hypothetical protein
MDGHESNRWRRQVGAVVESWPIVQHTLVFDRVDVANFNHFLANRQHSER